MICDRKIYPLSSSEMGVYLDGPETTAYNLPYFVKLWDGIDEERLRGALRKCFEIHAHAFMRVCVDEDGNVGKYIEKFDFGIPSVKADSIKDFKVVPFKITDAPLFRTGIYTFREGKYLYLEFHHIVIDGTGTGTVIRDIFDIYEGREVPAEVCTAEEYAEKELAARNTEAYGKAKSYYEKTFGGIECSSALPFDKSDGTPHYGLLKHDLTIKNSEVNPFVKSKKVKTSTFFLSAFAYLISKMNMEKEALLGTINNGRNADTVDSLGMFAKTLPFYARFDADTSVEEYLTANNAQIIGSVENSLYSFVDVMRDLGLSVDQFLTYQGDMYRVFVNGELLELIDPLENVGEGNTTVVIFRDGDNFRCRIHYRDDLFGEDTAMRIMELLDVAAREFLKKEKLCDIDLLTKGEAAALDGFNAIDEELMDIGKTVIDSFYECVDKYPDKTLAEFENKRITYAEGDRISNRIANKLRSFGVGREDVVSVLIPKCEYVVLASIGVLKALAAYQPLDPSYPKERLNFMMEDSKAKAVILDRALEGIIEGYKGNKIYLDEIESLEDDSRPTERPRPGDLFVMLYTSGTTGLPKGVMIEHGSVATMAALFNKYFDGGSDMKVSSYASYGFDAHMVDIYPTITAGGTVYVIPEKMRLDLVSLGEYFNTSGMTHATITTQVGRQFMEEIELKTMKHFLVGGEKLVPVEPPKGYVLHNAYGPTEGTVFCNEHPVDRLYYRVPIGKKIPSYKAYVVDENMKLLPRGVKGELCIAGPQVARGYLNRKAENEKAFIANPFDNDPRFKRMYKTGDIVRMLEDGAVDFIGRNDGQVKIRGFRVELTEVESVIRKYPGIKDATVKDFTDPSGIKFIAAYVVSDEAVNVDDLNAFIGKNKPPYMIPAFTMQIDKIPLNQNQKVNKRALPAPEMKAAETVPPEGSDEEKIYEILAAILGHRSFGVTTDFYAAGLSSVTAIKFTVQLSKAFGKTLKTGDLADQNTVRKLAKFLAGAKEEKKKEILPEYPLTKLQEGIFAECASMTGSTVYNIPILLRLDPAVDDSKLEKALGEVINAHPYLKMRIVMKDSGDVAAKRDDAAVIGISHIDAKELKGGLASLVRPFDLTKDVLFRAAIVTDGPDRYLFIDAHHIVFDGESLVVFMRELDEACKGIVPLKEEYTGFEYALDEAERLKSDAYAKAKSYYEGLLGGVDTECLPIRDRDDEKYNIGRLSVTASVSKEDAEKFFKESGATVNAAWNCAFGLTLSKFLARENCVYTTVYNGRSDVRLMDSVGMFVHTLPVVYSSAGGETGKEAVKRVAKQLGDSMANDIYPFSEISRTLDVKANIIFVYEGSIGTDLTVGGKRAENVPLELDALKAELSIFVFETEEGFRIDCEYNARFYEDWSIRSLAKSTVQAFKGLIANEAPDSISLPLPEDKAETDSGTFAERKIEDTDVVTLFERAAKKYPDNNAVIFRGRKITYKELDGITDKVASYIRSKGIGREDIVSILVPRGEYMVICALGALKSGAAYEPLDPSYPPERLNFMVKNAKAKLVVAERSLMGLLGEYEGDVLFIDEIEKLPDAPPQDPGHEGKDLFIVLYTSGTTGTPKGVMLEHGNLVNFCVWYHEFYDLKPESVVAAYASFGFDADMMDLYPALTAGAAVFIIPEDMRLDLNTLDKTFAENRVSHVFMTTQMGRMFAENMKGESLLNLSVGGETLAPVEPPKGYSLWNGYGPTECTIFSTIWKVDKLYYRNPIGDALLNYRLYVVGKDGKELPEGALGELWIAGAGVGRGYLDLPEQTARAFIKNPFSDEKGFERVYRTGDTVRRLANGAIDFIGRNDGQVKIRGFRIELSEVESVIREYPSITNVTVQAFDDKAFGGKFLAAYVTSDSEVDFGAVADHIRSKKPPYMVPAAFMQLDRIPLNQNQKVNKRALPPPQRSNIESARPKNTPSNPLEAEICGVFANILGLESIGVNDDFFEMGGTSISAAKIVMFAMNKNYPVAYKDIFDNPTARELARHIKNSSAVKEEASGAAETGEQDETLKNNVNAMVDGVKAERPLGRTFLTGCTGFLGSHVLKELLNNGIETVALVRGNEALDAETRLSAMMAYYFDSPLDEELETYVKVIDGEITNEDLGEKLKNEKIDTIINCAAIVKHFANDDSIERINVGGVENLIKIAKYHGARLVQISTLSVAGENIDNKFPPSFRMTENMLYFGQDISNKYVNSKFKAEKAILNAVREGFDGKVIRVGNLMGRQSDGEFQINSITNSFIKSLKAYNAVGYFPVSACDTTVDFSPIDEVAKAVVTLAKTGSQFTVFHAANSHELQMGDVIEAMNENGYDIKTVPDAVFGEKLAEMMRDEKRSMLASSLLTYSSSDNHVHTFIKSDNTFTVKALYRLGFRWPITDAGYLARVIEGLKTLEFFDREDV